MVRESLKTGLGFGLTSGIITTLGLMVGLYSGTNSKLAVIGGILTIAIADSFSDALGIHISEESKKTTTEKHVWESTLCTFFTKLFFALTFLIPVLVFPLKSAVLVSIIWGMMLLGLFSAYIAKSNKDKVLNVVVEHVFIALLVVVITYYAGQSIAQIFG